MPATWSCQREPCTKPDYINCRLQHKMQQDFFVRCICTKLMNYALCRDLRLWGFPAVESRNDIDIRVQGWKFKKIFKSTCQFCTHSSFLYHSIRRVTPDISVTSAASTAQLRILLAFFQRLLAAHHGCPAFNNESEDGARQERQPRRSSRSLTYHSGARPFNEASGP